jgi:hypothetical protein
MVPKRHVAHLRIGEVTSNAQGRLGINDSRQGSNRISGRGCGSRVFDRCSDFMVWIGHAIWRRSDRRYSILLLGERLEVNNSSAYRSGISPTGYIFPVLTEGWPAGDRGVGQLNPPESVTRPMMMSQ